MNPILLRALLLALGLHALGLALPASPFNPLAPTIAHAQDDDDDDGGDDDDDDDDGGGSFGGGDDDDGDNTWFGGDDDDDDAPVVRQQPRRAPAAAPAPVVVPLLTQAPDQVIVSGLDAAALQSLSGADFTVLSDDDTVALLRIPRGMSVAEALLAVAALVPDAIAAPNSYYRNQASTCTGDICASWSQVGWPTAQPDVCTFAPFIGVVDSGVNLEHAMLSNADIRLDRTAVQDEAASQLRHGTAVVAMFSGAPDSRVPGMTPEARVHVVDPFVNADGGDERADAFGLIAAIDTLVEEKVEVINLSLAGPANALLEASIARADAANIPVVAAVGNAGPRAEPLFPAAYDSVIGVSAVDTGGAIYRRAVRGDHVDFVAPGVGVPTAASIEGIRPQTGTSFAAPFVTVAVAAIRARLPDADSAAIIEALAASSLDLGDAGRDTIFGWGLVQLPDPCAS